jgi:hypothetical protein
MQEAKVTRIRTIGLADFGVILLGALALTACHAGGDGHVPDGRTFGVLESIDLPARSVTYAPSALFTGDEAVAEAAKDGATAPNGYYVRMGANAVVAELAEGAVLELLGWDAEGNLVPLPVTGRGVPRHIRGMGTDELVLVHNRGRKDH